MLWLDNYSSDWNWKVRMGLSFTDTFGDSVHSGFISEQTTTIDDLGFTETRTRNVRGMGKGKQPKHRKNVQKQKYAFNRAVASTQMYSDYFNPNSEVESRMLGLSEIVSFTHSYTDILPSLPAVQKATVAVSKKNRPAAEASQRLTDKPPLPQPIPPEVETQTQIEEDDSLLNETNLIQTVAPANPEISERPKKKCKISVTRGVDLAE